MKKTRKYLSITYFLVIKHRKYKLIKYIQFSHKYSVCQKQEDYIYVQLYSNKLGGLSMGFYIKIYEDNWGYKLSVS